MFGKILTVGNYLGLSYIGLNAVFILIGIFLMPASIDAVKLLSEGAELDTHFSFASIVVGMDYSQADYQSYLGISALGSILGMFALVLFWKGRMPMALVYVVLAILLLFAGIYLLGFEYVILRTVFLGISALCYVVLFVVHLRKNKEHEESH